MEARREYAVASLAVGGPGVRRRQTAHDMDSVFREPGDEGPETIVRLEDGQVGADNDVEVLSRKFSPHRFDESAEFRIHFGRSARQIKGVRPGLSQNAHGLIERLGGHSLLSVRARVDMTVGARLVAHVADVQLENVEAGRAERHQPC